MSRLFLLRHAKAAWAAPGMRDFDRPLEPEGRRDAELTGAAMASAGFFPDRILCSSARRARETWDEAARSLPDAAQAEFSEKLYSQDATGYLEMIRAQDGADSLLVVGHNPMMEDLAVALAGGGEGEAMAALSKGFPASGLAVIRFENSLTEATPRKGYLEVFITPADL